MYIKFLLMPQQFSWTRRICTATWWRGLNRNTSYYNNIPYFPLTETISVTNYVNVQKENIPSTRHLRRNIMYLRTVIWAHFNSFHAINQNCWLERATACALNVSIVCYNVSVKLMTSQATWNAILLTHRDYFTIIIYEAGSHNGVSACCLWNRDWILWYNLAVLQVSKVEIK
jgi:hypothetical protein